MVAKLTYGSLVLLVAMSSILGDCIFVHEDDDDDDRALPSGTQIDDYSTPEA